MAYVGFIAVVLTWLYVIYSVMKINVAIDEMRHTMLDVLAKEEQEIGRCLQGWKNTIEKFDGSVKATNKILGALKQKPEWIPCSERLPIGSDIVLLSLPPSIDMNGDELVGGVICGHYISGKNENWGISDGSTFGYGLVSTRYGTNPTHWMPLPKPYREEE